MLLPALPAASCMEKAKAFRPGKRSAMVAMAGGCQRKPPSSSLKTRIKVNIKKEEEKPARETNKVGHNIERNKVSRRRPMKSVAIPPRMLETPAPAAWAVRS